MANKQYLDSAGVTQVWTACKNKFAAKTDLSSYVPKSGAYMTGDLFNNNNGFYANTIGGSFKVYTNEYWQEKGLSFRAYNPIGSDGGVVQNDYTLEASGRHNMSGANAFFGVRTNQIILERSYDAGVTWESYEDVSIYHFLNVFVGNRSSSLIIPKNKCTTNAMFRITIASQAYNLPSGTKEVDKLKHMVESKAYTSTNRYMALNAFYTYQSTEYVRLQLTVQHAPSNNTEGSEPTFVTDAVVNELQGWSGGGSFHLKKGIFFGNANARFVRLIFRVQAPNGSFDNSKITPSNIELYEICAFSGGKYISDPQWPECFYNSPLKITDVAPHNYEFVGNYIPLGNKTQSIGASAKYLKEIYVDKLHANIINDKETGSFVTNEFPTIQQFTSRMSNFDANKISYATNEYYCKCENGILSLTVNLILKANATTSYDYIATDYGFYNKLDFASIAPYLIDVFGVRLNENPTQAGAVIAYQKLSCFPLDAASSASYDMNANMVLVRGDLGYSNLAQLIIAFSPSRNLNGGTQLAIQGTMTIPLWK